MIEVKCMLLCTGYLCDRKNTSDKYFKNNELNEVHQVESFATFGSGHMYIDSTGKSILEDNVWCGPNGDYRMYTNKEKK